MKLFVAALRHLSPSAVALSLLEAFGALWLLVEVSAFFSDSLSTKAKATWWLFVLGGLGIGLYRAWPRLRITALVPGTDCYITVRVCNIFSLDGMACIVGTNCTFDTAIEDGTISASSVQGQFTARFFDSIDHLDREIAHSLNGTAGETLSRDVKGYGKLLQYELGTVARVSARGRPAYLVAIANLNSHKVAQATREHIMDALPRLWESIRTRGGLDPLCCPILGSGFSRLDATREELIREIVRSFIPAVRAGAFCRGLTITVNPKDFAEGHVNLTRLQAFIQHECAYGSSAPATGLQHPVGVAES